MGNALFVDLLGQSTHFCNHVIEVTKSVHTTSLDVFLYESAFAPPLVMILSHVFYEHIGVIEWLIHESPFCGGIYGHSRFVEQTIVEGPNYEPLL